MRVAAVIPRDGGIVLVRHRRVTAEYYLLPGGGVEMGETLGQALEREVLEETGLVCRTIAPLFISDSIDPDGTRHMVQITFLAQETGVDPEGRVPDARLAGWGSVALADLAGLDLRPPMADMLVKAAENGFSGPALYLGPLWVPGQPEVSRETGRPRPTDNPIS